MLILFLLLVPACLGAPPGDLHTHVHAETGCTNNYCRVSNDTLDSALETFLCMNKEDIRGLQTEKEKKVLLAQKIAPLLTMEDGSSAEDDLSLMDTARLVPLVNLVLHSGDFAVEPKTELEYSRALREGLAAATSLHPSLYRRANPIVLGILNCQAKLLSGLHSLLLGSRNGRILDGLFGEGGLPGMGGKTDMGGLQELLAKGGLQELLAGKSLETLLMGGGLAGGASKLTHLAGTAKKLLTSKTSKVIAAVGAPSKVLGTLMKPETTTMKPKTTTMKPETTTMKPETTTMKPETTTVSG